MFRIRKLRQLSDEQLLDLFRNSADGLVLQILYERYGHLVFGLGLKYLQNRADAEDLTAEVFATLDQKIREHQIQHFKAWLYMLSKNACLMVLRKKKLPLGAWKLEQVEQEEAESDDKEELLLALERCLDLLSEEQAQCIRAFYLEEKSYQEIADQYHLSLGKVKSHIQNGKRNLRIQLEKTDEFKNAI